MNEDQPSLQPTSPYFFLSPPHSLISCLILCFPIFFSHPLPSHIHLPSLPILWFSAWLPSRLIRDGLFPEPPRIRQWCTLLNMPTNVTFHLFFLLRYQPYDYITTSPQERWNAVSEKWELSVRPFQPSSQLKFVKLYVLKCFLQIQKKTLCSENDY